MPCAHARLDRGDDRLDDLHPRAALGVALDEVPRRALGARCARACPRSPPRTASRFSRLRQSSSVSFHASAGRRSRASKRLSCSSSEMCMPELDEDHALARERALEVVDLVVGARPLLAWSAKPSTRSTSTRPYQERSSTAIPPQPGSAGQKRHRSGGASRRSVGAANCTTRTWRGSSAATSRLIAPPLPLASQPSKTHAHAAARCPGRRSSPPSRRRSASSRSCAAVEALVLLLAWRA